MTDDGDTHPPTRRRRVRRVRVPPRTLSWRKQDAAALQAQILTLSLVPLILRLLRIEEPLGLRYYGCRQGFGAVVPSALRRLPGRDHHQHDHVVQERTGFLRPHTQLQTRPDVSVSSPGHFCSAVLINT